MSGQRGRGFFVVAALLAAAVAGCGGGGDGGPGAGTQTRGFDFTVTVGGDRAREAGRLEGVAFFRNRELTEPGVRIESATQVIATPGATVTGQAAVEPIGRGSTVALHFDASGSIDDPGRDPQGNRFRGAAALLSQLGGQAPVRLFAFRWNPGDPADQEYQAERFKEVATLDQVRAEGARGNSPALTATFNIAGRLPQDSAMVLLTDGENNSEDPNVVPGCTGPEGAGGPPCANIEAAASRLQAGRLRLFVAGLGNNDGALEKFRALAARTGGAFVKVTRGEELEPRFRNLGSLMVDGGIVVSGRTDPVTVIAGGNPFVRGWMRFQRLAGTCPPGAEAHDAQFCKLPF
ncbi:MAG TPA: hypothetical protein VNM66_05730 [Thermodesulfobacteriota bacterium]|nr:hypothetical protein [Thermodesulfobacteriota bacterium]